LAKALTFWSMTVEESQIFWTMSCRGQMLKARIVSHETIVSRAFPREGNTVSRHGNR
jgi:hypothetical protein